MQTLERTEAVQVIFDLPQDIESKISQLPLSAKENVQQSLLAELKRVLSQYEPLTGIEQAKISVRRVIPKNERKTFLEGCQQKLSVGERLSENDIANKILTKVVKTGGLSGSSAEISKLGKEFRESFEFKHDQER